MTGQVHWIAALPLLLGGLGLAWLLWRDARAGRDFRFERRHFLCPTQRRKVDATLVRDASTGEVIGMRRCSGLADPETVTCGRSCVPGFGPRAVRLQRAAMRGAGSARKSVAHAK